MVWIKHITVYQILGTKIKVLWLGIIPILNRP